MTRRRHGAFHAASETRRNVGDGHQPILAAGVPMAGDERLTIGVGDDERVVADHGGLARQRPIDLELLRPELDDSWRGQKPARDRQTRATSSAARKPKLVRVVGVANPGDAALLDDLETVRYRLQRPHRRNDHLRIDAERRCQREGAGEVQDDRPAEQRREALARADRPSAARTSCPAWRTARSRARVASVLGRRFAVEQHAAVGGASGNLQRARAVGVARPAGRQAESPGPVRSWPGRFPRASQSARGACRRRR